VEFSSYISLKDNHFDRDDFQALYGKPLPENHSAKQQRLTLNTPLADFRATFLGKLVFAILKREFKKQTSAGDNTMHNRMVEKIMLEMPLQNLTNLSDGYFTEKTARALVHLANGEIAAALKALKTK
jgi:hypothetical protein